MPARTDAGRARAPHRSLLRALGVGRADAGRPLIGVANSFNELVPGHMHLRKIAEQVKYGVYQAGGIPLEFDVIGVCDGLAMNHEGMNYSLVSREVIADSVEIMARAHCLDGLVLIPNCDKVVPGMVMAAARLDLPVVIVSGGPMLAGYHEGRRIENKDVLEAVGAFFSGKMTAEELDELEEAACPTCGSCAGLFTANSMSCLTECLGLALPGDATIPAPFSARLALARRTGAQAVEVVRQGWNARRFLTPASPAATPWCWTRRSAAPPTRCSISSPSRTRRGSTLPLQTFNEVSAKTPHLVKLSPAGSWYMEDFHRAGGVMAALHRLAQAGLIDGGVPTISGGELAEQYAGAVVERRRGHQAARPALQPPRAASPFCSATWLPTGAVVKEAAVLPQMLVHRGPARVFDDEASAVAAIAAGEHRAGLRGGHPLRRPQGRARACPRCSLRPPRWQARAWTTGSPWSPTDASAESPAAPASGTWCPKPPTAGPIALVRDGDLISIDIPGAQITLEVSEDELGRRRAAWRRPERDVRGCWPLRGAGLERRARAPCWTSSPAERSALSAAARRKTPSSLSEEGV